MTKPIQKVAVIGAGTLGAQIAMCGIQAGYDVTVFDKKAGAFDATIDKLHADYDGEGGSIPSILPLEKWPDTRQQIRQVQKIEDAAKMPTWWSKPFPRTSSSNAPFFSNWDN